MNIKQLIFGSAVKTAGGGAWRDSIQAWLPIKNIVGGVVVTRDNRFVKTPPFVLLFEAEKACRQILGLTFYDNQSRMALSSVKKAIRLKIFQGNFHKFFSKLLANYKRPHHQQHKQAH